jgi:hypothetical protein
VLARGGRAWLRNHPDPDVQYLIALSDGSNELEIDYSILEETRRVKVRIAGGGGAVVRIADGRPTAILLKGIDERAGRSVAPSCSVGSVEFAATEPVDVLAVVEDGEWLAWRALTPGHETSNAYLEPTAGFRVTTKPTS